MKPGNKKVAPSGPTNLGLFNLTPKPPTQRLAPIHSPIWTEHKASLIARYLRYFTFVTKHGTYIDGFAGPQEQDGPHMWAAKLVLENEPRWLRQFYLFDADASKVKKLMALVDAQPPRDRAKKEAKRSVVVKRGDFNALVHGVLPPGAIKDSEATFCLLDQRTFECKWETVEALARLKSGGHKIELFYFLANMWIDRCFGGTTTPKALDGIAAWWGSTDWECLRRMRHPDRARLAAKRFIDLGYAYSIEWPIYEAKGGKGHVMYYMIHATDHPEAPKLMQRAYKSVLNPLEPTEQLTIEAALGFPFDSLPRR
jgi:three-Cys-motif partner protein